MVRSSGAQANNTGRNLEIFVAGILDQYGYQEVRSADFDVSLSKRKRIWARQYPIGLSIYGTKIRCDFKLWCPVKWPQGLCIETKWQQTPGSVDEKFPYLVENIRYCYKCPVIILADGGGCKPGARKWLAGCVDNVHLLHVFTMAGFQKWVNQDKL